MKAILNSVNNTILTMLRHDNDVEAESKTRYKVLRAVIIQGNNFGSKMSLLMSDRFRRLEQSQAAAAFYATGVPGEPIGGGIRKKYCPRDAGDRSPAYASATGSTNSPEKSSAPGLKIMERLTKIVRETEHPKR
ncbi:MAG: hypothetical protein WBD65_04430 [Methylocella sp.]